MITDHWVSPRGEKCRFEWHEGKKPEEYIPRKQVYGVCFLEDGRIAIGRDYKDFWNLPGGTPEKDETPEETLHREVDEELSLELGEVFFLGAQQSFIEGAPEHSGKWQLRYAAIIKEVKELTEDPDHNIKWHREFLPPDEFLKKLNWGPIADHMVKKACEWFEKKKKSSL